MEQNSRTAVLGNKHPFINKSVNEKFIDLQILDYTYRLKILGEVRILKDKKVEKYQRMARCGFVKDHGKSILVFDLRKNSEKLFEEHVTVVVAETMRNFVVLPIGFIVETIEDFFQKLN
jgi:hypothetical protein